MAARHQEEALLRRLAERPVLMAEAPAPIPLSVLIRTRNEADRIAKTIRSALPLGGGNRRHRRRLDRRHGEDRREPRGQGLRPRLARLRPAAPLGRGALRQPLTFFRWTPTRSSRPDMAAEIRAVFARPAPPRLMTIRKALVLPHQDRPPPLGFCHEQVLIYDRRIARTGPNPNWDRLDISASTTSRISSARRSGTIPCATGITSPTR
jgi:hypothetical protein